MDEKKQQELAGLLGMIGSGAGIVGSLAGTGSLISNVRGANRAIDTQYQNRILDQSKSLRMGGLNPQQKAAVKRLTGMDVSGFPSYLPISELPITINNRQYTLGEVIFDREHGITAKLPKDTGGLKIREAINQLVVPVQQEVLEQVKDKVKRKQIVKDVASQHVAAGGALPQINKQTGGISMIGGGDNSSALRQGALGSTAPTSSLITNEGLMGGPRTSFNEIAQRLPPQHPSATTGSRFPVGMQSQVHLGIPELPPSSEVQPRASSGMATQSNNFTGPETYPERQAAYREAVKELRPTGLKALVPKVKVPGTGIQAVKAAGRNIVRGVARAPLGTKIGTGVMVGGLAVKGAADNYAADKMVEDVVKQSGPPPSEKPNASESPAGVKPPTAIQRQVMDMFDTKYSHMSKTDKINEAKRIAASGGSGSATATLWLKHNAPGK